MIGMVELLLLTDDSVCNCNTKAVVCAYVARLVYPHQACFMDEC